MSDRPMMMYGSFEFPVKFPRSGCLLDERSFFAMACLSFA